MKQYFGNAVSLPSDLNYCPLSHESSPNDRIEWSEDEHVLGCQTWCSVFTYLFIFRSCIYESNFTNNRPTTP